MQAKVQNGWENIKSSLWFVPVVMVLGAFVLSSVLIALDSRLLARGDSGLSWLFAGSPEAAQTLLAVIAGSLITVISIAYSITILAIQQTSVQFTPRVVRTFTADRGNQVVLGVYMGTFIYALLVIRQIRGTSESSDGFVPPLAVGVAVGLSMICLGLLIYFIHHIGQQLQVSVIIDRVHTELVNELHQLYPESMTDGLEEADADTWPEQLERQGAPVYIHSNGEGFLRSIDDSTLVEASDGRVSWAWVRPQVGDYIPRYGVLVELATDRQLDETQLLQIRDAFVLDVERTIHQDALFGFRQLVDIALKALSPAINDPTTAEYCLSHMGDALGRLAHRPIPSPVRIGVRGGTRYIFTRPNWDTYVEAAFAQIRRQAAADAHVTEHVLRVLHQVALCMPAGNGGHAILHEVDEVRYVLDHGTFSPADTTRLRTQADAVAAVLGLQTTPA